LEALEFLPDPRVALIEMVRVLRPGGILLISNRIGSGVRWLPGRTRDREALTALLTVLGLESVRINVWQMDYEMAWARKPGHTTGAVPATLPELLRCPHCARGPLKRQGRAFGCALCGRRYPIAADGVVEMEGS
jgi:SAM-dependent methyltransferase